MITQEKINEMRSNALDRRNTRDLKRLRLIAKFNKVAYLNASGETQENVEWDSNIS